MYAFRPSSLKRPQARERGAGVSFRLVSLRWLLLSAPFFSSRGRPVENYLAALTREHRGKCFLIIVDLEVVREDR